MRTLLFVISLRNIETLSYIIFSFCYSASGTSAVAIDNKIEQAMDLVKSHLMFAVREEVEVLKERIAELMERINQLEVENTYLRAHASQDTLAQLPAAAGTKPPAAPQGPQPPVS